MIKKILGLAVGTLLSMNASAGYLQYEFSGPGILPNNVLGPSRLVIRDEDKSVAFFSIATSYVWFRPSEGDLYHNNWLYETTTSFTGLGPTNMYMRDSEREGMSAQMWLMFSDGDAPGIFNYTMRVLSEAGPQNPFPQQIPIRDVTYTGIVTQTPITAEFAAFLDTSDQFDISYDIPYYDPTQVPEPASLALILAGALGAAGAWRRRKTS